MTTPHGPIMFGQHTSWPQPVQEPPINWDSWPVQIAEVTVDKEWVITPLGTFERRGARWFLGGAVPSHASTPTWATAAAVLLAIPTCLLSLLFLLVKEDDVWTSKLMVSGGGIAYSTSVYSRGGEEYEGIQAAIAWAQRMPEPPTTDQTALPG